MASIAGSDDNRRQNNRHATSISMVLRVLKPPHTGAFLEATGPLADFGSKSGLLPCQRIKALIAHRKLVQALG